MSPNILFLALSAFFLGLCVFGERRLLTYLHIFQQEEYDSPRFLKWLVRTGSFDRLATLAMAFAAMLTVSLNTALVLFAAGFYLLMLGVAEKDPRKHGKKALVLTPRAKRIRTIAAGFASFTFAIILAFIWYGGWSWQAFLLLVPAIHLLPVWLTVANLLLKPVERHYYNKFWNQAHARFLHLNPTTIGITGSYGKTSVKHLMAHVLATAGPTYATKGSVNTPMGVSKAINTEMPDNTEFYVAEMGAYAIGSIARLCALTPPHYGIITALGEAHYERFKSLDNVARAKFELAEWVFKKNSGKPSMVVSEQVLSQPYAAAFIKRYHADFLIVGMGKECNVRITDILQTATGTTVKLQWKNKDYTLEAPVFGGHHGHNMALCFGMAMVLHLAPQQVVMALKSAPQIQHRLEVKPLANGITYIDDAYNSNPTGFENALQTLTLLKTEKTGRRILVTPGMIELGDKHDAEHARLGKLAAQNADIVLVVNPTRIPTFVEQVKNLGGGSNIHLFKTFSDARGWLNAKSQAGDVILLENDLPDVLEKKLHL